MISVIQAKRPVAMGRWTVGAITTAALALSIATWPGKVAADASAFDPATGYRIRQYRAPTPSDVPGGVKITLDELETLMRDRNALLIDVMPSEGAGPDPITGLWHVPKPRLNMAGSVWLPDVGKGVLTPQIDAYFKQALARLTGGDNRRAIVFYCQADCWMSWNAVKRASELGYSSLHWYPEGTDGMRDWDVPLVPAVPEPYPAGAR